jgi:hypothetical protein
MQHAWERRGIHIGFSWGKQKERDHLIDLDISLGIILKSVLEKSDGVVRTGFSWLRIGTSGGLLLAR